MKALGWPIRSDHKRRYVYRQLGGKEFKSGIDRLLVWWHRQTFNLAEIIPHFWRSMKETSAIMLPHFSTPFICQRPNSILLWLKQNQQKAILRYDRWLCKWTILTNGIDTIVYQLWMTSDRTSVLYPNTANGTQCFHSCLSKYLHDFNAFFSIFWLMEKHIFNVVITVSFGYCFVCTLQLSL